MKLKDIYLPRPVAEGGAATSAFNTVPVSKAQVDPTIAYFADLIGIPKEDLHPVGSTGKTAMSGDIDLGIDGRKYDVEKIHNHVMRVVNNRGTFSKGTRVGSYAVPIAGDPENGYCQVDLMHSGDIDWTKFSYFSPGEKSQYKGAIRNTLLSSVASAVNEPGIDAFVVDRETGNWLVRVGWGFDVSRGLKRMFQMRKRRADGKWKASMENVTPEEIMDHYPELHFDPHQRVIRGPKAAAEILFGAGTAPEDIETAEQIIELIKTKFSPEKADAIIRRAKEKFGKVQKGIAVPQL